MNPYFKIEKHIHFAGYKNITQFADDDLKQQTLLVLCKYEKPKGNVTTIEKILDKLNNSEHHTSNNIHISYDMLKEDPLTREFKEKHLSDQDIPTAELQKKYDALKEEDNLRKVQLKNIYEQFKALKEWIIEEHPELLVEMVKLEMTNEPLK